MSKFLIKKNLRFGSYANSLNNFIEKSYHYFMFLALTPNYDHVKSCLNPISNGSKRIKLFKRYT